MPISGGHVGVNGTTKENILMQKIWGCNVADA